MRRVEFTVIPFKSAIARDVVPNSAAIALSVSPDTTRYVRKVSAGAGVGVGGAAVGAAVGGAVGVGSGSGVVVGLALALALDRWVAAGSAADRVGPTVAAAVLESSVRKPDRARVNRVVTRMTAGMAGHFRRSMRVVRMRPRNPPASSITVVVRARPQRVALSDVGAPTRASRADVEAM